MRQSGDEDFHRELRGPTRFAPQATVGRSQQADSSSYAGVSEAFGLGQRLLRWKRAAFHTEQLGRLFLARDRGTLESYHPEIVGLEACHDLERVAATGFHHSMQLVEGHIDPAGVDGVGELPRWHVTALAQKWFDLVDTEHAVRSIDRFERAEQAEHAGSFFAEMCGDELARPTIEIDIRLFELSIEPHRRVLAGRNAGLDNVDTRRLEGLGKGFRHAAQAVVFRRDTSLPYEDEVGRIERFGQVPDERFDIGTFGESSEVAPDHNASRREERRGLGRVDEPGDGEVVVVESVLVFGQLLDHE